MILNQITVLETEESVYLLPDQAKLTAVGKTRLRLSLLGGILSLSRVEMAGKVDTVAHPARVRGNIRFRGQGPVTKVRTIRLGREQLNRLPDATRVALGKRRSSWKKISKKYGL